MMHMKRMLESRWHRLSDAEYSKRWSERVLSRCTRADNGCLIWNGGTNSCGYPQTLYRGVTKRCHRMLWQIAHNVTLPKNVAVCHTCDNRLCLEQSHHWTGSWGDNLRDCARKGRHTNGAKTHCPKGHEYKPGNFRYSDAGKGRKRRACAVCSRARLRIKAGWPRDLAYSMPPQGHGYRPVKANWSRVR
jgi:hypothetical protein